MCNYWMQTAEVEGSESSECKGFCIFLITVFLGRVNEFEVLIQEAC
jgi:hypothetical protein